MKILKNFNNFKLNEEFTDETGQLNLSIDGKSPTTWFYLRDAIQDGLLEDYFDLEVDSLPWSEYYDNEDDHMFDLADITDMIEHCVETEHWDELDKFLKMCDDFGYDIPSSISFEGETEDDEQYDVTYER